MVILIFGDDGVGKSVLAARMAYDIGGKVEIAQTPAARYVRRSLDGMIAALGPAKDWPGALIIDTLSLYISYRQGSITSAHDVEEALDDIARKAAGRRIILVERSMPCILPKCHTLVLASADTVIAVERRDSDNRVARILKDRKVESREIEFSLVPFSDADGKTAVYANILEW